MEDKKRAILNMVAEGRLSPQEAAGMLQQVSEAQLAGTTVAAPERPLPTARPFATPPDRPAPPAAGGVPVRRIKINARLGQATVVGDPEVHEVHVDGPHNIKREDDCLVIDSEPFNGDGFFFEGGNARTWGRHTNALNIRVNPDIELWVSAQAGSIHVHNINAPIHATAQAGSVNIDGFNGPIELSTQAGSVRARGRLDHGASTIRCEAGSVRVQLLRGSSVEVSARSTMGQVKVEGAIPGGGSGERLGKLTLGSGACTLDIETTVGSVKLEVEE